MSDERKIDETQDTTGKLCLASLLRAVPGYGHILSRGNESVAPIVPVATVAPVLAPVAPAKQIPGLWQRPLAPVALPFRVRGQASQGRANTRLASSPVREAARLVGDCKSVEDWSRMTRSEKKAFKSAQRWAKKRGLKK